MAFDLESYSTGAERFTGDLDREFHLHFSGQKPDFDLEQIYARHRDLFERPAVDSLRELVDGDEERIRRARVLLDFAVEGFLGIACASQEAEMASLQATLELRLDGEPIGYRKAHVEQANEADADRRADLEAARLALLQERINPLHREVLERTRALVRELGWSSYAEARAELSGIDLEQLAGQCGRFLEVTAPGYESIIDPQLERVIGTRLLDTRRSDVARFMRAPGLDKWFPSEGLVDAFGRTMADLGLDLEAQPNIIFDTEDRPTKSPRAYCAPVRVPQEVYLVVARIGGRDDYAALFHEGGHAEHYANADASLPFEFRRLGDNSVTESFAFLFEHITEQPAWLTGVLGAADAEEVASHAHAVKLFYLRRYAAKLAYELELHGPDPDLAAMPERYAELLGSATGLQWPQATWLDDVDGGFYVSRYLRAWALEARWRAALGERFGEAWFAQPPAGKWLAGLWRRGQSLRGDELASEVLGERLDFADLAAEFV